MFEALKILLDLVARSLPAITGRSRQNRDNKIGVSLFVLYFRFNEALINSEEIIQDLESVVDKGTVTEEERRDLLSKVRWQADNIAELDNNLRMLGPEFLVITDGDPYIRLVESSRLKGNNLGDLTTSLMHGVIPTKSFDEYTDAIVVVGSYYEGAIDLNELGRQQIGRLSQFLESRDLRQEMEEIRSALTEYRAALEANFSVMEILPLVGDRTPVLQERLD